MVGVEIEDPVVENDIHVVYLVQHTDSGMAVARIEFFSRRAGEERDLRGLAKLLSLHGQTHSQT